ncbi:MAG: uroporphyrinogen-III synthase, partial [Candidatus Obscuribacterales bacterium]|nr:uroporphyrinogen-III synthase [Candidatus Obscuribacterales bacterium]
LVFASTNAVRAVTSRLAALDLNLSRAGNLKIAAIGSSTAALLKESGLETAFLPSAYIAESFIDEFPDRDRLLKKKLLWPRSNVGRTLIADELSKLGATVEMVDAYKTGLPDDYKEAGKDLLSMLENKELDVITFASSQTVKNFTTILHCAIADGDPGESPLASRDFKKAHRNKLDDLLKTVKLATIGPVTSQTAATFLRAADIEASVFTIAGLTEALVRFYIADKKSERQVEQDGFDPGRPTNYQ